jgi:hypothetical protein
MNIEISIEPIYTPDLPLRQFMRFRAAAAKLPVIWWNLPNCVQEPQGCADWATPGGKSPDSQGFFPDLPTRSQIPVRPRCFDEPSLFFN